MPEKGIISSNGKIRMPISYHNKGFCIIDGKYYPFDVHVCHCELMQKNPDALVLQESLEVQYTQL